MKHRKINAWQVFVVCLLMAAGFACDQTESYVGTYKAFDTTGDTRKENVIELMENGEGFWGCCDGEVSFTWYVKHKELRIHTKEGGIMVGNIENESFTIALPGQKTLTFIKVPSP